MLDNTSQRKTPVDPYERIWLTTASIPSGKVASYGQLADFAGLPGRARMVGKALRLYDKAQPLPWHRVLRSNGQIAFPAGSEEALTQKARLQEEGVVVLGQRVKMSEFGWSPTLDELMFVLEF